MGFMRLATAVRKNVLLATCCPAHPGSSACCYDDQEPCIDKAGQGLEGPPLVDYRTIEFIGVDDKAAPALDDRPSLTDGDAVEDGSVRVGRGHAGGRRKRARDGGREAAAEQAA